MSQNSKSSRHLACALCRERKVKCGGEKPSCNRCKKAGESCNYAATTKPTRDELHQTIYQLNERIVQAEVNQATLMAHQQKLAYRVPSSYAAYGEQQVTAWDSNTQQYPIDPGYYTQTPQSIPTQPTQWQASIKADQPQDTTESSRPGSTRLPSLHDVQQWTWSTSRTPSRGTDVGGVEQSQGELENLLQEFITLNSTTEAAQYNVLGIANTVAMYSSYFRQSSSNGERVDVNALMKFLETLENRMQEIANISSQQVLKQTRKSRHAVSAYDQDKVGQLEVEMKRRAAALSEFFRSRYDLSSPLNYQS